MNGPAIDSARDESAGWVGVRDMDGGAVRSADPVFTQQLSRLLYDWGGEGAPLEGIRFESRHGDGLKVRATFERSDDQDTSGFLTDMVQTSINATHPELEVAMKHHNLVFRSF